MSISMQGPWQVTVVSKAAAFAQRLVIVHGDDTSEHDGVAGVQVDVGARASWTLAVEHSRDDGTTWRRSAARIQGVQHLENDQVRLRIGSDDGGGNDRDYNDLVLDCVTKLRANEHFVYGRVQSHEGCLFGCGNPGFLVIDNWLSLETVQRTAAGARVLGQLGGELSLAAANEQTSKKFMPKMIPLQNGGPATPQIEAVDLRTLINFDALYKRRCQSRALAGRVLEIHEYDRSAAELLGAPYSGAGVRTLLGRTVTDERGFYVFRFTRTLADLVQEIFTDIGSDDLNVAIAPDLIVGMLDDDGTAFYETAPHFDTPQVYRLNVCVHASLVPTRPELSVGGRYIQMIGDINLISNNVTLSGGLVTNVSPPAGYGPPITRFAAWSGTLRLSAALPHAAKRYALRWRSVDGSVLGPWRWHGPSFARFWAPTAQYVDIGPTLVSVEDPDHVGQHRQDIPTYLNIDANPSWQPSSDRAYLPTPTLRTSPGKVEIQLFAWDTSGALLGSDRETLYIDDGGPEGEIVEVRLTSPPAVTPPHECPLLELQAGHASDPLYVDFRLRDDGGFLDNWRLIVHRGKNNVVAAPPVEIVQGTDFFAASRVLPVTPSGPWLPSGHKLCAFSFTLYAQSRRTDGRTLHYPREIWRELVAIAQR